jgi:hypothetical protein
LAEGAIMSIIGGVTADAIVGVPANRPPMALGASRHASMGAGE